jgi:CubicO group peptidase (beta-lactamase class C family)
MKYKLPEQCGISSANIKEYVDCLEECGLSTHDVIIARGNDIVFEKYWKPFGPEFLHRMYSVSKTFVSIAVGFAIQDGYFSIYDKMADLFPEELEDVENEILRNQTVKDMLMMSTCMAGWDNWFTSGSSDRVHHYFHSSTRFKPTGTTFLYDSTGSFVLGALVERVTGKPFMEYLREKVFDKIGVSKEAYCLKCPGGHSWGDSAVLCTARDLLLFARFIMNGGSWNGEQLLNKEYIDQAVSDLIDTDIMGTEGCSKFGYGYLIWRTYDNSYFLNGMGCQFAVCVPDKDIILVYNGDNQGIDNAKEVVIRSFFERVARKAKDEVLVSDPGYKAMLDIPLELMAARGNTNSSFLAKVNGVVFDLDSNPMGISEISVRIDGDEGELRYVNAQGKKAIRFGMLKNLYENAFPQEGYSRDVGSVRTKGHYYKYAASAAWTRENTLHIKVQIIDDYFGRLDIRLLYLEDNKICVRMQKTAEDFLDEYNGTAYGRA